MADVQTQPPARNAPAGQQSLEKRIEERIDLPTVRAMETTQLVGGAAFIPQNVGQMLEISKMMATSRVGVRNHLRNNPGACLAVVMQAARWGLDPFAVANKSYEVNDQIAFESQLITAVINTRAPIQGRLKTRFEGEGATRRCIAWAYFAGDSEPTEVESPPIGQIKPKNSPLWTHDPDQQLAYYTKRLWARRECPEVLLGVYDIEEAQEMRDVTPPQTPAAGAPPRPTRADFAPKDRPAVTDVDPKTGQAEQQDGAADPREAGVTDGAAKGAADPREALSEEEQTWLADIEERVGGIDSLSELAEFQHEMGQGATSTAEMSKAAMEMATTVIQLRQRAIAGGTTGRG